MASGGSGVMEELQKLRQNLEVDVTKIERLVSDMEANYLQAEYSQCGSVLKGFEGFLSSKDNLRKRSRTYKPEDRLFSLSSKTSPATREMEQAALEAMEAAAPATLGKKGYAQKGYAQKGKRS